jgi:serine protease Do
VIRRDAWRKLDPRAVHKLPSVLVGLTLIHVLGCSPRQDAISAPRSATPEIDPRSTGVHSPADIAARSTPAIVSIRTEHSLGTGFVVSNDGLVASNLHVVAGNSKIMVTLSDHREFEVVEVFNGDRERDLVILRIEAHKLPSVSLGDSGAIRPGDAVVAIGHPLGLEDTVSNGLVSGIRKVDDNLTVLQISAPIAPGSSGGPIFNDHGEVIGVATAILLGGQNINFGVPIVYVKELLKRPSPVSLEAFATATLEEDSDTQEPRHNVRTLPPHLLDGCRAQSVALLLRGIGDAIDIGAPLYNDGNPLACYHIYEGAASDLQRQLGQTCPKAAKTLADGRRRAAQLTNATERAWAMRDTFDSLLDVIKRWGPAGAKRPAPRRPRVR